MSRSGSTCWHVSARAPRSDRPCVALVDDAHLADAESLRAVLFAARRLLASRALVVSSRPADEATLGDGASSPPDRPAARSAWGRSSRRMSPSSGLALGVEMTADAARRLWEHTGGSPLYAEAVLRELPHDSSWQHEPRPLPVPDSYAQLVRRDLRPMPAGGAGADRSRGGARRAGASARGARTGGLDRSLEALDLAAADRHRARRGPRRHGGRRVLARARASRDLPGAAEGAALGAQHRRRGRRARRGRGPAPPRGGGDHRQRRPARRPRGACPRRSGARRMVGLGDEPDRRPAG